MKRIYICGKVTGDSAYREKFLSEENRLMSFGYTPLNPAVFIPADEEWEEAMKKAIRTMLLCDGVSLLPDWQQSKGAKIEARIAREVGIEVRESAKWS